MLNYSSSRTRQGATVGIVECWKYFLVEFLGAIHQHSVMISDIQPQYSKLRKEYARENISNESLVEIEQ